MEKKEKVFCNYCSQTTNHIIKSEHIITEQCEYEIEPNTMTSQVIGIYKYQILECSGCESITFRRLDIFDNVTELDHKGNFISNQNRTFETYYPERIKGFISKNKIVGVPIIINKLFQEIIDCYNYDLKIMCSAGLRAIVESLCNHFNTTGNSLADRINKLKDINLLSQSTCTSLHSHRFIGNYALHRLEIPEKSELNDAIEIIEHTLKELFELPIKDSNLRKMITKRVTK